jgi:hypothetical protein
MTIPAALLMTIGVIVCACCAFFTGDSLAYKSSVIAGVVGTSINMVFFYRRLHIQMHAERRRLASLKKKQDETKPD